MHLELHVVVRGASCFEGGGERSAARHVRPGDVLLLRGLAEATSDEAVKKEGAVTLAARYEEKVVMAGYQLAALAGVTHLPARHRSPTGTVAKLVALLSDSSREAAPSQRLLVQHLFDALLVAVLGSSGSSPLARPPGDPRIARTLLALEERLHERWTTARMAKAAGMSRAAFALRFVQVVGAPPLTHLVRLRIARAAALLVHTDHATTEVARDVGYRSVFAFSRAFKRLTGVPPTVYRRRERQCGPVVACAAATRLAA